MTAFDGSNHARASSNHDGVRSRLPTTCTVSRSSEPEVGKVSAPDTEISGTSSPAASVEVPSVLKTGPGRWMTNDVGMRVSASRATSATASDQTPMSVVRLMGARRAGTIVVFSSNNATSDLSGRSFAIGVHATSSVAGLGGRAGKCCD